MATNQPTEIITVTDSTVACDGTGGALGHPRVFLHIETGHIDCPYCGRRYVLAASGAKVHSH